MNKYIKIKGHPNWFLLLEKGEDINSDISSKMKDRLFRKCWSAHNENDPSFVDRLVRSAALDLDYSEIAKKAQMDVIVRPIGSYMFLTDDIKVTNTKFDTDFPIDNFFDVVICENDAEANWKWVEYLEKRFKNKTIGVISMFDLESDKKIKRYFKKAKYVTFTTSFTSMDWWEKLVKNLYAHNKVIGHCINNRKWKEAKGIYNKVEIIKTI